MSFINDDQFRTLFHKDITAIIRLDEVNADNLKRVVIINAGITLNLAIKTGLCVGTDDHRLNIQLVPDFVLPLFTEMGQADHGKALDFPPLQQLFCDQECFDSFTDTDIISNQQTDRILTQGHDERHHLVGTGAEGELGKAAERPGAITESQPR